ncbi:MAG: GntR family transcriptional regulator [Chloroflexota bacterium]
MSAYRLGPRASRVLEALRQRILRDDLPEGTKLPSHSDLAATYGVAPLTMRQVLARLEEEGLVQREQGRGTFVRRPTLPSVLILEDEPDVALVLSEYVKAVGARPLTAVTTLEGLTALREDTSIALVLSDVHVPDVNDGLDFIRAVRRRWPDLPLVAVTAYSEDLAPLHGTPEWPVLVVPKPFVPQQIREALNLGMALRAASRAPQPA